MSFSVHFSLKPEVLLWWAHWWTLALPIAATLLCLLVRTGWVFFRYYRTDDLPYGYHSTFFSAGEYLAQQLVGDLAYLLLVALAATFFKVLPPPFWLWAPALVVLGFAAYICLYTEGVGWLALVLGGLIPAVIGVGLPYSLYFGQPCTPSPAFIVAACVGACFWFGADALFALVHVQHIDNVRRANQRASQQARPLFEDTDSPSS